MHVNNIGFQQDIDKSNKKRENVVFTQLIMIHFPICTFNYFYLGFTI